MSKTRVDTLSMSKEDLDELENLRNKTSMAIGEIEAVLELGMKAALAESSNDDEKTDWVSVISALKRIATGVDSLLDEMCGKIYNIEKKKHGL